MAKEHTIPLLGYDGVISEIDEATATPDELFHNHIRLAIRIALEYHGKHSKWKGNDFCADLVMVALRTLWHCASSGLFDSSLQMFHNYAHKAIKRALYTHYAHFSTSLKIGESFYFRELLANRLTSEKGISREDALVQLYQEGKTYLSNKDPLPDMQRDVVYIEQGGVRNPVSIWDALSEVTVDDREEMTGNIFCEQMYEFVTDDRCREVLRRTIDDGETLESIGDSMGLTRERIRQLKEAALNEIRRKLCKGGRSLEQLRSVLL